MRLLKSKRLSDKIFGYTMLFYLIVVCAITFLLVAETYRSARLGVLRELKLYETTFSQPLTEYLWFKHMARVSSLIQGILQIPEIVGVRIIDPNTGQILARRGWVPHPRDLIPRYYQQDETISAAPVDKQLNDIFDYRFRLVYRLGDQKEVVGEVTLFSDMNVIVERIKYRVVLMVAGAGVQVFFLWIFFSWISRRFLSRPLLRLKDTVESFDLEKPEETAQSLQMKGDDELAILSRAFSAMQKRLVETVQSLKQNQLELRHLNENLEKIVHERTAELKKVSEAVEQSPASVVITDKKGTIEYINPTFSEVTGYSAEEAIGQSSSLLKSGSLPESFYKDLWDTIIAGRTWKGDFINRKKSGEEFWESASISSIKNDESEITHFVAVKQDITERKKMETAVLAERERLQKILDTSPVGVGISTEGVVRFANPRFAELFYSKEGEDAQQAYVNPDDRKHIVTELEISGIVRDYELQTYGANREICDTLATFISTEYEGQSGILAWMVDLSGPKGAEKELKAKYDELARFRRLAIGREQKMIELKKEINEHLRANGLSEKYKIH